MTPPRRTLLHLLGVIALASLLLVCAARGARLDLSRLHTNALHTRWNDQVGYVTMARSLAETGRLRPHVLYTAALWMQPRIDRHHLYLPGHYAALALGYRLFGYSAFTSLLPNLLGYVLCAAATFLLAWRLSRSRAAAWLAALLWLGFPPLLLFSFSAMAELTLCCAAAVALCAFVYLPPRRRPLGGALLLCLPFLFRDIAAFLVAPLCALVLFGAPQDADDEDDQAPPPPPQPRQALLLGALAVAFTGALFVSPLCAPRITLLPGALLDGHFSAIYCNATRQRALAQVAGSEYLSGFRKNLHNNLDQLERRLFAPDPGLLGDIAPSELYPLVALMAAPLPLAVIALLAWRRRERRLAALCLSAAAVLVLTVSFTLLSYDLFRHRGLRLLLFTTPLCAATLAAALQALPRGPRRVALLLCLPLCAGLLLHSQRQLRADLGDLKTVDKGDDSDRAFLESLGHDDHAMLVAPPALALDYLVRHYPVDYAFIPANGDTLRMLTANHRVGTLLLPDPQPSGVYLSEQALQLAGLRMTSRRSYQGVSYRVFQPPGPPARRE